MAKGELSFAMLDTKVSSTLCSSPLGTWPVATSGNVPWFLLVAFSDRRSPAGAPVLSL